MTRLLLLFCLLSLSLPAPSATLTVAVAANAKYAFDELAAQFGADSGIRVQGIVSSSGKLAAQVRNGAPFDVFLSADTEYPESLHKAGFTAAAPRIYAYGSLVLWTRGNHDLGLGMGVLTDKTIQRIALANPRLAPYGREALKALEFHGLRKQVESKLVYGESIAQVNQYIDTQSAEIGFTAKSIVLAPDTAGRGKWLEVPLQSYAPIAQSVAILNKGHGDPANAKRFVDYLFSSPGRDILLKYGYRLP
jgi:molybdate transport system substrate-binding protein